MLHHKRMHGWLFHNFILKVLLVLCVIFVWLFWDVEKVWVPYSYDSLYSDIVTNESINLFVDESIEETDVVEESNFILPTGDIRSSIEQLLQESMQWWLFHESSDDTPAYIREKNRQHVCDEFGNRCDYVDTWWRFSRKDEYVYTAVTVYILDKINRLLHAGQALEDVLERVTVNATRWNGSSCERNNRWCANHHSITLNLWWMWSLAEYVEVLTHELWHVIDLGAIEWTARRFDQDFTEFGNESFRIDDPSLGFYSLSRESESIRKRSVSKQDFCSGYAMSNPFEDFAECFNLYLNHNTYFKFIAQSSDLLEDKYIFMANLFDEEFLFRNAEDLRLAQGNNRRRVYDTTRMKK